jgi:hypothetical protein
MRKGSKRTKRTTKRKTITVKSKKTVGRRKRPTAITIRRSSGRKEKFDIDRMAQTTGRSGVPFLMARDIAKNVSKKIRTEAKGRDKKVVTAGRVRSMITKELRNRNQRPIASSYSGERPHNESDVNSVSLRKPPVGSADRDQHEAYRADRDSVLYDRSKRLS